MDTKGKKIEVETIKLSSPLSDYLSVTDNDESVRLWWLGQAGFALRYKKYMVLIQ